MRTITTKAQIVSLLNRSRDISAFVFPDGLFFRFKATATVGGKAVVTDCIGCYRRKVNIWRRAKAKEKYPYLLRYIAPATVLGITEVEHWGNNTSPALTELGQSLETIIVRSPHGQFIADTLKGNGPYPEIAFGCDIHQCDWNKASMDEFLTGESKDATLIFDVTE
jgi:hypothetical protein